MRSVIPTALFLTTALELLILEHPARGCWELSLMSRTERKYWLISTSYLAVLFDIFILLHISQNCVCFGDFLPMRTLCDAYHKEFESQ